jgi:hypothetical protein
MAKNSWWGKLLRILGIVLMSLTAAFTLMGGAGTTCVALNPTGYEGKFSGIAPFQWLYICFVLVTVAIGVMGVRAVVLLCQAKKNAYRFSMITLVAGILVGGAHIFASRSLRGSSMPVDMVVYTTVLTFIIFLIFRIPAIWKQVDFEKNMTKNGSGKNAASFAMAVTGLLAFTIQFIMAPTHTISGVNYADVWHIALSLIGGVLFACAIVLFKWKNASDRKVKILLTKPEL